MVVPPEMFWLADWMIWPSSTSLADDHAVDGRADGHVAASLLGQLEVDLRLDVLCAGVGLLELGALELLLGDDVGGLRSSVERARCACAVVERASRRRGRPAACADALRTSRGSTSPSRSPRGLRRRLDVSAGSRPTPST
jgi:hypothetical protein